MKILGYEVAINRINHPKKLPEWTQDLRDLIVIELRMLEQINRKLDFMISGHIAPSEIGRATDQN